MPIESKPAAGVALFLFAHQDDEFGVYHVLDECRRRGQRAVCAYLTRGARGIGEQRNEESLAVLRGLGVRGEDVIFAGDALGIDDAALPGALQAAGDWMAHWMASFASIGQIYVTAWEGGHHDHDALHALVVRTARQLGQVSLVRQFALYNAYGCPGPFFRVLSPLAANGTVTSLHITWRKRLHYLCLCLQYPSQRKTWLGLFPFVFLHYVFKGTQTLQAVDEARLQERPHEGPLYYERRGFYRWELMQEKLRHWHAGV